MDEKRTNVAYMIVGLLVGILFTGVFSGRYYSAQLEEMQNTKEVIVTEYRSLENVTFKIVKHDTRMLFTEEEMIYWDNDFLIKVFRQGKTYYIKLYTFAEFKGD